jgi:hypothetical protein
MNQLAKALFSSFLEDVRVLGLNGDYDPFDPFISVSESSICNLKRSLFKKFLVKGEVTVPQKTAALQKFLHSNESCKNWTLKLSDSRDEVLWGELKRALWDFWHPNGMPLIDSDYQAFDRGRTGPGASLDASGTSVYHKLFASKLSTTSRSLYESYRRSIAHSPSWLEAEETRLSKFGDCVIRKGNQLSYVPKNNETARVIATEPSLNMFYQLGIGELLCDRLHASYGINIPEQQAKNQVLAQRGSAEGWFSTIDLSGASDSVGLNFLRESAPPQMLRFLCRYRSPLITLESPAGLNIQPNSDGWSIAWPEDTTVEAEMISSMGNGFTFALETVIFACIVRACYRFRSIDMIFPSKGHPGNFAVYGDDIIVESAATRDVLRLLEICGFTVNTEKTFTNGPFRESCGADFQFGANVRGVFIKSLDTKQDFLIAVNLLNQWSAKTGLALPNLVKHLLKFCKGAPIVPYWENDDSGLKLPGPLARPHISRHGTYSYECYQVKPYVIRVSESDMESERRRLYHNPLGLMLAFLQGSIRSSKLMVRHRQKSYDRVRRIAHSWDIQPSGWLPGVKHDALDHYLNGSVRWERWNTAVTLNIS